MMTELSFLLTLLLDHELPKEVQGLIKDRIREIERTPLQLQYTQAARPQRQPTGQSASTQRILDQMAEEGQHVPAGAALVIDQQNAMITQPAQIAQTPAAAAALAQRQEAIRIATSGKEEKGRSSPRKF